MNRLPSYDPKQSRSEKAPFLVLNVVALVLIAAAVHDSSRFVLRRGQINQALITDITTAAVGQPNLREEPRRFS